MNAKSPLARSGPFFAGLLLAALWAASVPSALAALPAQRPTQPSTPAAAAPALRHFDVHRAEGPIEIDGSLDDAGWKGAAVIDLPYEWYPGDNTTPPVQTEAWVTFDGDNLYVAFKCLDPDPQAIRANLMDRDLIATFIQDDHVGFNLDTFNDERRAYQFRVNPRGVQTDAVFSEIDSVDDFSWDAIWASAGAIDASGYTVEMAIPFRQIRFPRSTAPQTWGIELFRSWPRSVRHRISSRFTDRAKDCILCQENKISGFTGIVPGRDLEVTPTLTATRTDSLDAFPDGNFVHGKEKAQPGVTARWGVTPNVNLSATWKPDFSQVEADAAQLSVNTRFANFFPEKRPFFLEGADLYTTPLQAVFTRTVAEPDFGLKVNAKEGKDAYGLFLAQDNVNNLLLPGNQGSLTRQLQEEVRSGVFRYRRDLGERSTLGVLYTDREADDYHNRVAGLDGFLRFTPSDTVRVQYLRSDTQYPRAFALALGQDTDSFSGNGLSAQYDHFDKVWKGYVRYQDLGEEFRADSGFIPRVDIRSGEGQYERLFYGTKDTWYAQASVGLFANRIEDHTGRLTDQVFKLFGTLNGPLQSSFTGNVLRNKTFFGGRTFDLTQSTLIGQFSPTGRVLLALGVAGGDDVDVENVRRGNVLQVNPAVQLRLGSGLNFQLDYLYQKLDVPGGQLFHVGLAQTKIVYQFNVRTFVRAIVQYQDLRRNTSLYLRPHEPQEKDLFGQFLFSYKLNPQTVLFVGYTDTRFGVQEIALKQTDRTFFLKLGYALLF
jgi:hypothetical protein